MIYDTAPIGKRFGDVLVDVDNTTYRAGDTVRTQFVGANPRVRLACVILCFQVLILVKPKNNLRLESTFLTVDRLVSGQWKTVRTDSHPSTTYQWHKTSSVRWFFL